MSPESEHLAGPRVCRDHFLGLLIQEVRLDGERQIAVQEVDLAAKTVVRGMRLAPEENPGERRVRAGSSGFVFDLDAQEFVFETVAGETLEIVWKNPVLAARALTARGLKASAYIASGAIP